MNAGFQATVKLKPLESGSRYEFHSGYINAYPKAQDGYNRFFDVALEGCNILLNREITSIDMDKLIVFCDKE